MFASNKENNDIKLEFNKLITDALTSKNGQAIIDGALLLLKDDLLSFSALSSYLEWHICHQSKMVDGEGDFLMSQVLIPIAFSEAKDVNAEVPGLLINHITTNLMKTIGLCNDSIVLACETFQKPNDLRGTHCERYGVANKMVSSNWPHDNDSFSTPETGAILYLYLIVLEPIKDKQNSLEIDSSLTSPELTKSFRLSTENLLKSSYRQSHPNIVIMVGNPSSYTVSLNQKDGYMKLFMAKNIFNEIFNDLCNCDVLVVINKGADGEISVRFIDHNECIGAFVYGDEVIRSGMNDSFNDLLWIKEKLEESGFENIIYDNKDLDTNNLHSIIETPLLKILKD